jgi:Carbohydrate esterase, sialic acid-specific acetylesterase
MMIRLAIALGLLGFTHSPSIFAAEPPKPVKVFILAGQSNMEGQAVVDLDGKDYNDGKGTLNALFADPAKAKLVKHLKTDKGEWTVRENVWVRYQREMGPLLAGPLGLGFSVYGDQHHFGPELQFGHVLGDHFTEQVLLIKTAWGGKSLYKDFRPPSSGGEVGPCYRKMLEDIRKSLANLKTEFPRYAGQGFEVAGFVWYQGWNDGVDPKNAVPEYEQNLVNLIKDVRKDLKAPNLPVVIGELTGPWVEAPGAWATLRKAQASAATKPEFKGNVLFVETHDFVRPAKESPNPSHGHHEFGNAETYFLVGDALGKGVVKLLTDRSAPATEPKKSPLADKGSVKVFILAGQSNMEGKAPNTLLDYQAADAKTRDLFAHLRKDDKWIVRDDVFIKFLERKGPLTVGYGSPGRTGVELEFGTAMGNHFEEPVILIKTAWGGHSLYKSFRSPSAGFPAAEVLEKELKQAQDRVKQNNDKNKKNEPLPTMDDIKKEYGSSYRKIMAEVKDVMDNSGTLFPSLKGKALEVAGFVWFQGWNDQYGAENEYESNMKHFIEDIRKDLNAPKLPFVIAAMGQNGSKAATGAMLTIQKAQLAMNDVPEFMGNVKAIRTDVLVDKAAEELFPKWRENKEQWDKVGGDFGYHYYGSAIWFNRIGKAMGDAMLDLLKSQK